MEQLYAWEEKFHRRQVQTVYNGPGTKGKKKFRSINWANSLINYNHLLAEAKKPHTQ